MSKKITLKDVASHAGVSVTTVSNVMRDWPYISEPTRIKVQQSIRELGYSPNPIAQGLRTGRSQVIGFIVPELGNPHFASLVSMAEAVAQDRGYSMLIFSTHEDTSRERQFISYSQSGRVDGLIVIPASQAAQYIYDLYHVVDIPLVLVDRVPNDIDAAYCNIDNYLAIELAIKHLHELGHTRIAHISGPESTLPGFQRMNAYQQIISRLGMDYQVTTSNSGHWNFAEGYRAMTELLRQPLRATAVIAGNDVMAIGACHAVMEQGLNIPQDISIIGIDDIDVSQYLNPPLTTVKQPVSKMAEVSIEILLDIIQGKVPENIHVSLMPELVIRGSTTLCK